MAENGETPVRTDTFDGFIRMVKIGTAITVVVTIAVVALIAT
ncbi:aa3-type cytochrome c oxidase subunit IV [Sphingomonas qomolangmaensis]|uniref:Aa3-type cytochrome c oxidase subunit IV n=1 Tax=Sphingomonas qomolangmaensis TaxID=2918765 RepID=A0ABY5L651_9SPHN|nr:aa3-type cytochrome c oxidase subunit IV [Sphingomonas qomolangmaensis]UUL82438.1 aa3-type cytochrome c oxidase subunit IV [Sphingomonas qomolangmaensis]